MTTMLGPGAERARPDPAGYPPAPGACPSAAHGRPPAHAATQMPARRAPSRPRREPPAPELPAHRTPSAYGTPSREPRESSREPREPSREPRRAPAPVMPVTFEGNRPAWLVLGYRELLFVLSSPDIFTSDPRHRARRTSFPADWSPLPGAGRRPSLLRTDHDEHRRRYRAVGDVLGEVDIFLLRSRAEAITDSVIDDFASLGSADLMTSFAHQVPALVLASLCGADEPDTDEFADDLVDLVDDSADAARGHRRIVERLREMLERRLEEPTEDIISQLIDHPAELTDEEVAEDLAVLFGFAMRTVTGWIGTSLRLLLTDRSFALELAGGRRSVMQALTRVLWEDPPVPVIAGRWATRDIQLGGQRIRAGDMVALGVAAANSDPRVRLDRAPGSAAPCPAGAAGAQHDAGFGPSGPGGPAVASGGANSAHLAFGHGSHRCPFPAQEIAEVITRTAVEVLLDRLPNLGLAVPAEALVWRRNAWRRTLSTLPVQFSPV